MLLTDLKITYYQKELIFMLRVIAFVLLLGFASAFAKSDTLTVINCKCDTLKILRTVDTAITVKLDTLKAKVEKKAIKVK
jgi:hypothetical protein